MAHPDIPAEILEDETKGVRDGYRSLYEDYISVRFSKPVGFSLGRPGLHHHWDCNINILFNSPAEARAGHDPNWMHKSPYKEILGGKVQDC